MPKLTKRFVDSISEPGIYRDSELPGFYIEVSKKSKIYKVRAKVRGVKVPGKGGKICKVSIGKHGVWTAVTAREEAQKILHKLSQGIDVLEERKEKESLRQKAKNDSDKVKEITLRNVFEEYKESRNLKENTKEIYSFVVYDKLSDWVDRPLIEISKDMVERKHKQISIKHPYEANHCMRILRAVFNYAIEKYEDSSGNSIFKVNPVDRLKAVKAWNRETRRKDAIKQRELKPWCSAVSEIGDSDSSSRDYLLFVLFTGLRKEEAATLRWCDVDFKNGCFTVSDTKNHIPHTLFMSDYIEDLLRGRKKKKINEFVFPSKRNASGHIKDIRYHLRIIKEKTDIEFTIHSLRGTFITIAQRLGINPDFVKGLANHKTGDVTFGYTSMDDEDVRETMQRITDYIVNTAEIDYTASSNAGKTRNKVLSIEKAYAKASNK